MPETLPVVHNSSGHNQYTNGLDGASYAMRKARAKAMLDSGSTYDQVILETGLCRAVVADVSMGRAELNENVVANMKKVESGLLTRTIGVISNSFNGELIEKANLTQRAVALGILIEKRELLDGRPTQRTAFLGKEDHELEAEITALQDKLSGWEEGKIVNAGTLEGKSESVEDHKD